MGLPDHLRRLAQRVAQHEMGHYVVARALGFRTGDVSIELTGPVDGHRGTAAVTLPQALRSLDDLRSYLERRVIVLYAGGAAETLPGPGAPTRTVDIEQAIKVIQNPGMGAEQDHAKARELIHTLRNVGRPDTDLGDEAAVQAELTALDQRLFTRAVELVEANADTIVGLASNLAARVPAIRSLVTLLAADLEALPAVRQIAPATP
jgi:hypothetical protein